MKIFLEKFSQHLGTSFFTATHRGVNNNFTLKHFAVKKIYFIALALLIGSTGIFAQYNEQLSLNFEEIKSTTNYQLQRIMTSYDAESGIAKVDMRQIQNGRNHLLTDRTNGRKLYLLAKKEGERIAIGGFAVQDRSGRWIKLGNQSAGKGDPTFGCPDGWDFKIICYTHPAYNVEVCYTRCTPTEITLSVPAGL